MFVQGTVERLRASRFNTQRHTETHTLADTHTGIHTNAAMLSIGLSSSVHIMQFNLFLSQLRFY